MGIVKDALSKAANFVGQEIMPVKYELMKAGVLSPYSQMDYQPKASLVDPFNYQATVYGYKEKYSLVDYIKARQISYSDPIISAIIQTRTNQVAAFAVPQTDRYKTGFKISLRDKKKKGSPASDKKANELEQFMMSCGYPEQFEDTPERKKRDNLEMFFRKIVRDSLSFDQLNFEIIPRNNGMPSQFLAVDASTIRLIPDLKERRSIWGASGAQDPYSDQVLVRPYWLDETSKVTDAKYPKYMQVINGTPRETFDEWEMAFGIRNPRTDILSNGYGLSEIELLLTTITAHLNADTYNRNFFSNGAGVKGVLAFEGHVPPDQLEGFRRNWHQNVASVRNAWKTPIVGMGKDSKLNWISMHSTNKEMEWGKYIEYLTKTICGVYQIDPIEIGFDIAKNSSGAGGGAGIGGQGQQVERLKYSKDKGLDPLLRFIANLLNEYIIWRIDPDYEFEFVGLNSTSEKEQIDIDKAKVETFQTLDELRAEHDLKPIKTPDDIKSVGDMVLNPQFIQAFSNLQMRGGDEGGMPGEEGAPGEEGMGGPLDDGDEPDYENMSTEDLEKELASLDGKGKGEEAKKSISARQASLELLL